MRTHTLFALSVLWLPLIAGCEADVGPVAVGTPGLAIGPGYYYDEEYVDGGGFYHPRDYWYHDGHAFSHRDGIPAGIVARDRSAVGYARGGEGGAHEGGHEGSGHR